MICEGKWYNIVQHSYPQLYHSLFLKDKSTTVDMALYLVCSNCHTIGIYDQHQQIQFAVFNRPRMPTTISFHTLFHVLGRYHEHQRPDRDEYVMIQWNNIEQGNQNYTLRVTYQNVHVDTVEFALAIT